MKLPMNFISGCTSTRRLAMLPVDLSLIIVQLVVLSLTGPLLLLAYWHPGWHKYGGRTDLCCRL